MLIKMHNVDKYKRRKTGKTNEDYIKVIFIWSVKNVGNPFRARLKSTTAIERWDEK